MFLRLSSAILQKKSPVNPRQRNNAHNNTVLTNIASEFLNNFHFDLWLTQYTSRHDLEQRRTVCVAVAGWSGDLAETIPRQGRLRFSLIGCSMHFQASERQLNMGNW